jgi:hypothetical protein
LSLFLIYTFSELQILADEKAVLEACHQDCTPSVDVAKQLDDRDAAHKVEVVQLKGRIAELLEEKEQREGQLKKAQELLVTSETDASNAHAELTSLKEQATKWEVTVAHSMPTSPVSFKSFSPILPDIPCLFLAQPLRRHILLLITYFLFFRHVSCFRRRR